jgi:hypothetical protein
VVADVAVEVGAFGIGLQELLVGSGRDAKVEIAFSAAELDLQTAGERIIVCPSQKGGI